MNARRGNITVKRSEQWIFGYYRWKSGPRNKTPRFSGVFRNVAWKARRNNPLNPQLSPHFESPGNCNRRLAFQLIDARCASPAACECTNAIVVSKAAGCQFALFVRLFPDPRRTCEYCRMAAETVRRHFDPPNKKGSKERWREGEEAMCATLHLTRKSLQALDAVAARSRHGELVISIDWEMRKRALEFAWELVARFRDHLQGMSNDHWKLLDVR